MLRVSLGPHLSFTALYLKEACSVFSSDANTSHVGLLEYFPKAENAKFACKIIIRMCPHIAYLSTKFRAMGTVLCCVGSSTDL